MNDPSNDFFRQLITEYIHSRPNAKKQDPKRVAKRLGVRKRDFDEFLQAWVTFFSAEGAVSQKDSKGKRGDDKNREAATTREETRRLSGVIKRIDKQNGSPNCKKSSKPGNNKHAIHGCRNGSTNEDSKRVVFVDHLYH